MHARCRLRFGTASSSRSTGRTRTPSPTGTSARKSGSSATACTDPIACCTRRRKGPEGRGQVRARDLGRGDGAHRRAHAAREGGARRRVHPAVFVRRVERSADAGQFRRAAVAAVRHIASGANAVRGADRRRQHGALRQDAVGHLSGLSRGRADHPVGRQPVVIGYPPHPVRSRGTGAGREARRRRSPIDADVASRRRAPAGQAWHRRRRGAGDPPAPVHDRARRRAVSSGAHARRRSSCVHAPSEWTFDKPRSSPASAPPISSGSPSSMRAARRRSSAAAGGSSGIATAATPRWPSSRCPAVGGKFGVRGGGYSMSNSASWNIERPWIDARNRPRGW